MDRGVWLIEDGSYPEKGDLRDKVNFWLRYAILAPSAHNTQPWKCSFESSSLHIYRDPKHTLASDQTTRLAHIGLGAFIENLSIVSSFWGYDFNLSVTAFSPHDLEVGRISFAKSEREGDSKNKNAGLFRSITSRHTNRGYYFPENASADFIRDVKEDKEGTAETRVIAHKTDKESLSKLVATGTEVALSLPSMRRELAEFVYSNKSAKDTGMPIESMIQKSIGSLLRPSHAIARINPKSLAKENDKKYSESPLLVIICTSEDGPESWIDAGRLMQRTLLRGVSIGYSHDIAAAPTEIPTLLPTLRKSFSPDLRPQILFRLGKPRNPEYSIKSGRRIIEV